jgi:hypothetical protein
MKAALLALLLAAPAAAQDADSLTGAPAVLPAPAAAPLTRLSAPPKDAPLVVEEPRGPAKAPPTGLERREGAEKDRVRPALAAPAADESLPRKARAPGLKPRREAP